MASELKRVDLPYNAATSNNSLNSTGQLSLLNGIQQGYDYFNRISNSVRLVKLKLDGQLTPSGNTGSGQAERLRIIIFWDRQSNGGSPAVSDLLLSADNAGGTTTTAWSEINWNNTYRFVILDDFVLPVFYDTGMGLSPVLADAIDYNTNINYCRELDLKDFWMLFKASTNPAAITDISVGTLWMLTIGTASNGVDPYQFTWRGSLYFYDE